MPARRVGARADGTKELLALELGYRESTESWATVVRSLRERGLSAPLAAVGNRGIGLWAALRTVYPSTRHPGGLNLVLFPNNFTSGDQILPHDPHATLPRDQSSWPPSS